MREHKPLVGVKLNPKAPAPASPAVAATPTATPISNNNHNSMMQRSFSMLRRVRRAATGTLAVVGLGAVAALAYEMQMSKAEEDMKYNYSDDDDEKKKKKKVLVIPFHRMKLVETKKNKFDFGALSGDEDRMLEIEIHELVNVIHAAAQDPSIVALYGIFGHGFQFQPGGWAHIEEIRNALKVWRESHRFHLEPNLRHDKVLKRPQGSETPKPSYAFADTFSDPFDKGNKEYLVACAFSHIHMQKNGELNLFGVASSSPFFRSFMEKYGIKAHVFKHGKFKNMPNIFTETGYTREHRQNVQNLLDQIDTVKRSGIMADRNPCGFDNMIVWKMVQKHGSFTGNQMLKLGLVDHLPTLDPLDDLLKANGGGDEASKEAIKSKWGSETDMDKFQATEKVKFTAYMSTLKMRKKLEDRKWKIHNALKSAASKSSAFEATLGALGYSAPHFNLKAKEDYSEKKEAGEKIAVVTIEGSINDAVARKTLASLRKIKKDDNVKAVILRLNTPGGSVTASESILQECKDMPQPCIASMGNVCASGGYYVATGCKQIFALPSTITGSIGVFAVKFDLTGLAKKYGINVQYITTGPYAAGSHPFQPLNSFVKANLSNSVDRHYDYFKSIVAESRGLDMKDVEALAQGKVWTGGQAQVNGLVDKLGGLERAIAYAQHAYTSGDAQVERWPKPEGILQKLSRASEAVDEEGVLAKVAAMVYVLRNEIMENAATKEMNEYDAAKFLVQSILNNPKSAESMKLGGVSLSMDETAAMSLLIGENVENLQQRPLLHPSIWNEC